MIFEDYKPNLNFTIKNISEQLQVHVVTAQPRSNRRLNGVAPVYDYRVGFFDGASKNRIGGIGVHLIISKEDFFCIIYNRMWSKYQHSGITSFPLGSIGIFKIY